MRLDREQRWVAATILVFLAVISIPYLIAQPTEPDLQFGGFLVNPIDGHSYLAKMRQGYEGSWSFTLPYTAEPGEGSAINLYYLFLGHAARAFGLSLIFVFHFARVVGAALLALSLYRLAWVAFQTANQRLAALVLALFGSGLGWIAFAFGVFTGDFWVAEAYPFLAGFTNAHFPIGMALQVWFLTPGGSTSGVRLLIYAVGAAMFSAIYPFGWATTLIVLLGWVAWLAFKREPWAEAAARAAAAIVGGAPYAIYALFIANNHPVLAQWNAQNQTLALSPVDLILSLSPALLLAAAALLRLRSQAKPVRLFVVWLVLGALALYVPINLQRRLISGLYVPAAGLAIWLIANRVAAVKWRRLAYLGLLVFSLPTNLLILAGAMQAVRTGDERLTVHRSELAAYAWLDEHARGALVLAAPETGLRLPAYASVRVVYGHPFETVNATDSELSVVDFYKGIDASLIRAADFVMYGPREARLGDLQLPGDWAIVYAAGGVQIWAPTQ